MKRYNKIFLKYEGCTHFCEILSIYIRFLNVWPSMVTNTRNLCSAFNPSKCTHSSEHTYREHTPGAVRWLAQGFHLSRGIEGGENARYSLPPPSIPAGPEIQTHNLGPTLYQLGHDCPLYIYIYIYIYISGGHRYIFLI